jgi:EAL domain-containing protein (putative c-di-GMP-specific phosphodiesterase class I)
VENVEDVRTLIELGCQSAQGFLFAKPMNPVRFVEMLGGRPDESTRQCGDLRNDSLGFKLTA